MKKYVVKIDGDRKYIVDAKHENMAVKTVLEKTKILEFNDIRIDKVTKSFLTKPDS